MQGQKKKRIIFASILLAFFQILHFLHGFSLLTKVKFLEDFYDSISDDKVFEIIFGNEENDDKNEEKNALKDLIDIFKDETKLNIPELISKKSRIKFLKECFGIINGMSYCNSIFSILLDIMDDNKNKILSYKVVFYSIFNPGGGIILASFALIPSMDCCNHKYNIKGIIICFISIILGLIVMLTPISLILGLYLTKVTNRMITLFPIKITLIFIGILGIFYSLITSGSNKKLIKESYDLFKEKNETLLPFEIVYRFGKQLKVLSSELDSDSFCRLICNMIFPGSGTMSLICKYKCKTCLGIFGGAVIQFLVGGLFFLCTILINFRMSFLLPLFYNICNFLFSENEDINFVKLIDYLYTIGLCFYFSGIFLILISSYLPKKDTSKELSRTAAIILNLFTGGLGTQIFLELYGGLYNPDGSNDIELCNPPWNLCDYICWMCRLTIILCRQKNCKIAMFALIILIGGFIGYFGTLYCIFFSDIASKASKITYPIFYFVFSIISGLFPLLNKYEENNSCPIKKKISNKYHLIKMDDDEIYN